VHLSACSVLGGYCEKKNKENAITFIRAAQKGTQLLNNAPQLAGAFYDSIFTANRTQMRLMTDPWLQRHR
jgi:hypothetical protein